MNMNPGMKKLQPERGQLWRCPHCGKVAVLVQTARGFVPVQPVLVKTLAPIANIDNFYDPDGKVVGDVNDLVQRSMFRPVLVFVPHGLVCGAGALLRSVGESEEPEPPPPDVHLDMEMEDRLSGGGGEVP